VGSSDDLDGHRRQGRVGIASRPGQSLASASPADLARQLANANAALGSARLQQKTAQDNVDALTSSSPTDQVRQAKIALKQREEPGPPMPARLAPTSSTRCALGTIKAPIAGIVTAVNISKGLTAPSGDAITIDADTFDVTASVVESDVAKMAVGQAADVSIAAVGADLTGQGQVDRSDRDREHDRRTSSTTRSPSRLQNRPPPCAPG
jgi:multidrug resistance efflux pump